MQLLTRNQLEGRLELVASSANEAETAATELGCPVVIKAMIPVGGRGKAGLVKIADTPELAASLAKEMLGKMHSGHTVREVAVTSAFDIEREFYLSIIMDPSVHGPMMIFSPEGGVDIEALVISQPDRVARFSVSAADGSLSYIMLDRLLEIGLDSNSARLVERYARRLARIFVKNNLMLAEINPLAVLRDGTLIAADCKLELDDAVLARFPEYQDQESKSEMEDEVKQLGGTLVTLSGDIGVICNGAGMGMAIVDMLADQGLHAANFLDTGGGPNRQRTGDICRIMLKRKDLKGVIITFWGGFTLLDEVAEGILDVYRETGFNCPLVVKLFGINQEKAMDILEQAGIMVAREVQTEKAVALLSELIEKAS
jgi:succinyl-CoA synthetase beta subunit